MKGAFKFSVGATCLLLFLMQPAKAYTIESLVDVCTSWANSGFSSIKHDSKSISCISYFSAVIEISAQFCFEQRSGYTGPIASLYAADVNVESHTKPVVRSFLNWANTTPEMWASSAIANSFKYVAKKWPCN